MTPVMQIEREDVGNCLQCCLASILDLTLDEVPDFGTMGQEIVNGYPIWYLELNGWLAKFGYFWFEMKLTKDTPFMPVVFPALAIFMGDTEMGRIHAIVGKCVDENFVPVHNPFPAGGGLVNIQSVCFLVPRDPCDMVQKNKHPAILNGHIAPPPNIILPDSFDHDSRS